MEEEKRSREGKLRDRLAKKRKAKEEEMQKAALSERVSGMPTRTDSTKHGSTVNHVVRRNRSAVNLMGTPTSQICVRACRVVALELCLESDFKTLRAVCCTPRQIPLWCFAVNITDFSYGNPYSLLNTSTPCLDNFYNVPQEKQIEQKNLEDEERAERQRFHDQARIAQHMLVEATTYAARFPL